MKKGEKTKCLNCSKEFELNKKTFWMNVEAEYITCPYCNKTYDVNNYHARDNKMAFIKMYLKDKGIDINKPKEEFERLFINH